MIFDKLYRIFWGVLFVLIFPTTIIYKNDMKFAFIFICGSAILFILDFSKIYKHYKQNALELALRKKWHIFANFTQWLFWSALITLPFNPSFEMKYKVFVFVDLFIVSTFTFYKFTKQNI